jgi:hypothetical protein
MNIVARKFWTISGTGDYRPESNPLVNFNATYDGNTGLTVSSGVVTAINALGATSVKIPTWGAYVSSATGTTIVLGASGYGATGTYALQYYKYTRPCVDYDKPILGVLPVATSPGTFSIVDAGGNTATFAAGSLKQGTLYPIQITRVLTTTANDFIGFSDF